MSEHDYQRGLRGGDCNVSTNDWERWRDWKAGHDAYHRQKDAESEGIIMESMTAKERDAYCYERIREIDEKLNRDLERMRIRAKEEKEKGTRDELSSNQAFKVFLGVWLLCAVIGRSLTEDDIGLILGGIAGFIIAGVVVVFIYD